MLEVMNGLVMTSRIALRNAASIAGLLLFIEAVIIEIKGKAKTAAGTGADDFDY